MSGVVPKLRFPEFSGNWRAQKLSAVLKTKGRRNKELEYGPENVLSVSGELGVINQIEHLGRSYAGASVAPYSVVETGDIVYTKSPLKSNPFGIIKANRGAPGIVSTLYAVYKVRDGHDPYFWDRYFELDDRTNRYLKPLVNKGAKNDMKISNDRVLIDPVVAPELNEQIKISTFLSSVDSKIDALRRKEAALKTFKAGLMQKLFSQEMRFRRDDGSNFPDWEVMRLGDAISRIVVPFDPRKENESPVLIELDNIESGTGRIIGSAAIAGQISLKHRFAHGDVLYGKLRPYLRKFAHPNFDGVCSSEIWVLRGFPIPSGELLHDYLYALVQSNAFQNAADQSSGSKMPRADWDLIAEVVTAIPHPDEQRKIASALSTVDVKAASIFNEITQMETFKKGLLQQLFT